MKPPEMIGALRAGQIDAFIAWEPYPAKAGTMGVGINLARSKQMWSGHPCCVLISSTDFLKQNPETVRGVVAAHVAATDFIDQHPEESISIGVKYTGMDETTVRHAMNNVDYTYTLSIQGEKEYVTFLSKLGYIRVDDPDRFVDRFIKQDILKDILNQ
jgi:NitT/TauT family transport system substrate-binding protein